MITHTKWAFCRQLSIANIPSAIDLSCLGTFNKVRADVALCVFVFFLCSLLRMKGISVGVVGGGFSGLAVAHHLAKFQCVEYVRIHDANEPGQSSGASRASAGLLHPLTPRGKLLWMGEEGYNSSVSLLSVAQSALQLKGKHDPIVVCKSVIRPIFDKSPQSAALTDAVRILPKWMSWLSKEDVIRRVGPLAPDLCSGGILLNNAVAINSGMYLEGLALALLETGKVDWITGQVENWRTLLPSYDAVVLCMGAEAVKALSLKDAMLNRGQAITLVNDRLNVSDAMISGGYCIPMRNAEGQPTVVIGATHEFIQQNDLKSLPDPAAAREGLLQKPIFSGLRKMKTQMEGSRSGIRVVHDRGRGLGRIPMAGRVGNTTSAWAIAALGSRGLVYHALMGRLVSRSIVVDHDLLPSAMGCKSGVGQC